MNKSFFLVFILAILLSSCSYKNRNRMLLPKDRPNSSSDVYVLNPKDSSDNSYLHRIKPGDRIAVKFLNNYDLTKSTFNLDANPTVEAGYVIDNNGFANMPLVGKIQLSGLSREGAAKKLEKLYSTVLTNPSIEVSIVSIKVNVFGEVGRQGKYLIDRDNLTLIDLLSEAGGLTTRASKKDIRIIRGDPRNPEIVVVDLRKVGILRYSELQMQDNDIVIVDPKRVYEFSDPSSALATAIQPLFLIINTAAVLLTLSRQ